MDGRLYSIKKVKNIKRKTKLIAVVFSVALLLILALWHIKDNRMLTENLAERTLDLQTAKMSLKDQLKDNRMLTENLAERTLDLQTAKMLLKDQYKLISEYVLKEETSICAPDKMVITDSMLGLVIDSQVKTLQISELEKLLSSHNEHFRFKKIQFHPGNSHQDVGRIKYLKINTSIEEIVIRRQDEEGNAFSFDFLLFFEASNKEFCHQEMRLHFSEPLAQLPSQFKIQSVIGRNGIGLGRFSLPYGTEFYKDVLWITDCSNENISRFSLDGQFLSYFSSMGTRLGDLDTPADIKIRNGMVYVVEERNHRLQVFNENGETVDLFGSYKETEDAYTFLDKFNNPLGVAVSESLIVVVDYGNNRILAYDYDFNYRWVSGNQEGDEILWVGPYYAEYDPDSDVFLISNRGGDNIVLLSSEGEKLSSFGDNLLVSPHELAILDDGDVIVANLRKNSVVVFDKESNYKTHEELLFPVSYGLIKTVTDLGKYGLAIGFVGNGQAYFLTVNNRNEQMLLPRQHENIVNVPVNDSEMTQIKVADHSNLGTAREVYSKFCSSCHENGDYGAPAKGNIEAWDKFSRDINVLLTLAKEGNGAMISKGGCDYCSDEELLETIKYMLPMTWNID